MKNSILILVLLIHSTLFSQNFQLAPVPKWVDPISPIVKSEFNKYDINGGLYCSLYDYQVDLESEADFIHYAYKIVSNAGISSASEIYISYDTSYQNLDFHYLNIWRNGKKIERTDNLTFEFLNNEQNLNQNIYTGSVTAYDILEDIRNGDIVEYAYTIVGDNPIFKPNVFRLLPVENTNPIDKIFIQVYHQNDDEFFYGCAACEDEKIKSETIEDATKLTLEVNNVSAVEIEETSPSWIIPFKYFYITNTDNWKVINDWALTVFNLETKQDLTPVFEEVFSGDESTEAKIDLLLNYVQNEIRYMGIESGIGSIKPFTPEKVISQRFGDCKDKSLLFVELLKEIGVKNAFPVLVSTSIEKGVDDMIPNGHMFDHVIVYFEYDGKSYWVDPTSTAQGGTFKNKSIYDYGKALIVRPENDQLTSMNINDTVTKTVIEETLTCKDYESPAAFEVKSILYGQLADYFRAVLEYYSIKEASNELKSHYELLFPSIYASKNLRVEDDMENNIITLYESYSIPNLWNEEEGYITTFNQFQYEPIPVYSYVNLISCEPKKFPVQLSKPSKLIQRTTLNLPKSITISTDDESYLNDAFKYSKKTSKPKENIILIEYEYEVLKKEISPSEYQVMCNDMNQIVDKLPINIRFAEVDKAKIKESQSKKKK